MIYKTVGSGVVGKVVTACILTPLNIGVQVVPSQIQEDVPTEYTSFTLGLEGKLIAAICIPFNLVQSHLYIKLLQSCAYRAES